MASKDKPSKSRAQALQKALRTWGTAELRASIPPAKLKGGLLSPEAADVLTRTKSREREKYRAPRARPPRGAVRVGRGKDATLVPKAELARREKLTPADLAEAPAAFEASYFATPTVQDFWLSCQLRLLLGVLSRDDDLEGRDPDTIDVEALIIAGQTRAAAEFPDLKPRVPKRELAQMRKAWEGAYGPIADYWEDRLTFYAKHALPSRQAGGRPQGSDGVSILRKVRAESPPGTVPAALTADKIERLLKTSTVARGGGTKGRTKNVDTALAELIAKVKVHTR